MLYIFSVYDSAAGYYKEPFTVSNKGVALREFADACNSAESYLSKHPGDYTLFLIGTFDESTGVLTQDSAHVSLGKALEYVKPAIMPVKPGFSKEDAN